MSFFALIQRVQSIALDIFFPKLCIGCGRYGSWVCEKCAQSLPLFSRSVFMRPAGRMLFYALYSYDNALVRSIVHALKYEGVKELSSFMARALYGFWNAHGSLSALSIEKVVFAPIPLHRKKLRERGWNQAELVSRELGTSLGIHVFTDILARVKNTLPQSSLSRPERLLNMRGAFTCGSASSLKDKTVVLIDDVMTTGATLEQAAVALRRAGISDIRGLVFARGG